MAIAVRTENLSKTFPASSRGRPIRALERVSFSVEHGQIFGLLGQNGCGKTTTLRILTGFVRPTAGSVWISGDPAGSPEARRRVGFLPESPAFDPHLTGTEFLGFAFRLAGLSRRDAARRGAALIERVGLAGRAGARIGTFSKGMRERLGIAHALVGDPEVLVLDEPMSGLDPIGRRDVRDLLGTLREDGRTILFSTHILADVETLCDRIAIVAAGALVAAGAVSELLGDQVRSVEIVVRALSAEAMARFEQEGTKVTRRDGGAVLTFASIERADAALVVLVAEGVRVVSVTPNRGTLEELFAARASGALETR